MQIFRDDQGRRLHHYGRGSRILARFHADTDPLRHGSLYVLDFKTFGARVTAGWYRTPWRSRVPSVDETWVLHGFTREGADAFVQARRQEAEAATAPLVILNPDGSVAARGQVHASNIELPPPRGWSPIDIGTIRTRP